MPGFRRSLPVHGSRRAFIRAASATVLGAVAAPVLAACGEERPTSTEPSIPDAPTTFSAVTAPTSSVAGLPGQLGLSPDVEAARRELLLPPDAADAARIAAWREETWTTNFDLATISLSDIDAEGIGRDALPPIDLPQMVRATATDPYVDDREPVVVVRIADTAHAYPLQILVWHQVVNDVVAGEPIAVTYAPLGNAAAAVRRTLLGATVRFGSTGLLRASNPLLWDDLTESWWQQLGGRAVIGDFAGVSADPLPATILAYGAFKAAYPDGRVLSRNTGYQREYGTTPYAGYDSQDGRPYLFAGTLDTRLAPMSRVLAAPGSPHAAVPFESLRGQGAMNLDVGNEPVVALWEPGTVSALDRPQITNSRDIGSAVLYHRQLDDRVLELDARAVGFRDLETGSRWTIAGQCNAGPLQGATLRPVVQATPFWFAWAALYPDTVIR